MPLICPSTRPARRCAAARGAAFWLAVLAATGVPSGPSHGQTVIIRPEADSHRPIPSDGSPVDLSEKYQSSRQRRELVDKADIVKKILEDPAAYNLNTFDVRKFRNGTNLSLRGNKPLDLNDPGLRELLGKLLKRDTGAAPLNDRQRSLLRDIVKNQQPPQPSPSDPPPVEPETDPKPTPDVPPVKPDGGETKQPDAAPPPDPTPPGRADGEPPALPKPDEELSKFMAGLVDRVKQSDALRKSPALRDTVRGLEKMLQRGDFKFGGASPLGLPAGTLPKGGLPTLPGVSSLPKMSFSLGSWAGWRPQLPALGSWFSGLPSMSLPRWSVPDLGIGSTFAAVPHALPSGVGMPHGVHLPAVDTSVLPLVLVVVGVAVLGWVLWGRFGHHLRPGAAAANQRWSVDPARVTSAGEVIKAFECLSLSRFGVQARARNHRRLAHDLGTPAETARQAADRLARLYERLRYDPAQPADLSAAVLQEARQDLAHLVSRRGVPGS